MSARPVEIICAACGADTLIRREPVYDGFRKAGERLVCVSCGHVYPCEEEVPFKTDKKPAVFGAEDRPETIRVFTDDERGGTCRLCRHYVKNPFVQRCGLHGKPVEATDFCGDFAPRPAPKPPPADEPPRTA